MIVLLGTNAYTAIMRGDDLLLAALQHAQAVLMSSTVVGEPEYSYRYAANRQLMNIPPASGTTRMARFGARALKETATSSDKTTVQLLEERLEAYRVKTRFEVELLLTHVHRCAHRDEREALAVKETTDARREA